MDHYNRTGEVKIFTIHATQMVWNARYKEKQFNGYQAIGMLPEFDDNFDCKDPENEGKFETFFLSGEVLHVGIAEHQKMFPDPSLRIITREDWDKKAADSPSAKAPPQAKQSKKKRQTKHAKVVAPKRKSRSNAPAQKDGGTVGACRAMGDDCANKSSRNQTTRCSECTIWVHPKKGCSIAKGNSFVCEVCWSKSESESSSEESVEKPPPPVNETHKKPHHLTSSDDSSTEGEEEVQEDASGEGKEEEEDEATVVDTDDEDSPPGGRCFRCRGLCSISPVLKTIRVDGKLRMFDPRCYRMFKAGIEHPTVGCI